MIKSIGDINIEHCDDANVPVNCSIFQEDDGKWTLHADNFMPRKSRVAESMYREVADTKEELVEVVNKHVVPLYEAALKKLKETGGCYYWA